MVPTEYCSSIEEDVCTYSVVRPPTNEQFRYEQWKSYHVFPFSWIIESSKALQHHILVINSPQYSLFLAIQAACITTGGWKNPLGSFLYR